MMIAIIRGVIPSHPSPADYRLDCWKADDRFKMANKIPAKIGNNDEM